VTALQPAWQPAQAVVIGAGSGIGRCVAHAFAGRGIPVRALCRRPDAFDAGASGLIDVRACDVTAAAELHAGLAGIGADTVVVHTAAAGAPVAPIWQCDEAAALASITTMVTSVWQSTHDCLEAMVAAGSGLVLLASSGAAGKVVGAELRTADSPVGVAAFYPGMVDTAMQRASRAEAERLAGTPFGRDLDSFRVGESTLLDPADVADDIVTLATRTPAELNGQIWRLREREWSAA
jgi:NADP-dependent 3-hydroxy acid dehydrogenase YdfG